MYGPLSAKSVQTLWRRQEPAAVATREACEANVYVCVCVSVWGTHLWQNLSAKRKQVNMKNVRCD